MMTSSRQERDLVATYQLGVNAYVVKPLKFQDFVAVVKHVGLFWAVINESPEGREVDGPDLTAPATRP